MTDLEQKALRHLVNSGRQVLWIPDEKTALEVISVTPRIQDEEGGLCANFAGGTYAALDGCEMNEFAMIQRLEPLNS